MFDTVLSVIMTPLPRDHPLWSSEVLSYAGVLTITAIVDADHGPDPDDAIRRLRKELDLIMAAHQ